MPANLALDPKFKARAEETMDELKDQFRQLDPMLLKIDLAGLLLLYLLFCYCGMLICKKTGHEPGGLIWVPVLQIIPLLKGAGLSAWWFLLWVIPVANIFPIIFWCVKICRARGKNPCLAVLLVLPLINIFTFLYLAFADSANDQAKPLVRKVNFG